VLIFFFFFTVACFIPLGYLTGSFMQHFPPIKAYSINVLGSLFGIWTFSILSFFSTPPIVWFALGFALFLVLIRRVRFFLVTSAAIFAVFLLALAYIRQPAYWSPYYKINVAPIYESSKGGDVLWGYSLDVNQDYHQNMLNLSAEFSRKHGDLPSLKPASFAYDSIYEIFPAKDVLVVGAGSGNDVAAALRHGAESIDAVEIDPVILKLGKELHPEAPYDSERVYIVNDDARAYFNKTKKEYDIIVFGLLDSHTMISGMSNLRLDNYVYTVESFRKAKAHLKENGIVALSFSVQQDWIGARISRILEEVFQQTPICYRTNYDLGIMFVVGPGLSQLLSQPSSPALKFVRANLDLSNMYTKHEAIPLSTDDWPYLYLKDKKISWSYLIPLAVILVLSLAMTLRMVSESRKISFPFFFLGGAFLLIEFKSITDMALLFGSTWLVNSFVISSILLMILGANYVVSRFQPSNVTFLYILLGLCLLFNYFVPVSSLLSQSFLIRGIVGSAFLSLPIFFAGIIFATFLKRTPHIEIAFGSNLLGAVIGGFLEYSSMVYGLRNLLILSAVLYALSLVTARRSRLFFPG
jgi:SAM-dependent methyltransferase